MEQVLLSMQPSAAYFWSTYSGAEVDLLLFKDGKRYGIEFKFNEAPRVTKSMHVAINDLSLDHLWIIYPGNDEYPVSDKIMVKPLASIQPDGNLNATNSSTT